MARLKDLDRQAASATDTDQLIQVLADFQSIIHYWAATPRLAALLRSVQRFVPGGFYLEAVPHGLEEARRSRRRIITAVQRRGAAAAAAAVLDLFRTVGRLLTEELERRGVFSELGAGRVPWRSPSGSSPGPEP